jgi:hypothetical protein
LAEAWWQAEKYRTQHHKGPDNTVEGGRSMTTYIASHTRTRRTTAEVDRIRAFLFDPIQEHQPMTIRQVFYQAVTAGLIDKTENEYDCTIVRLLKAMHLSGQVPFDCIADNTRWMRKPTTYNSISEAIYETAKFYRQALWRNLDVYVEVWLEKEALAGVLVDVTSRYDVPLMVTRGYASLSFLHTAAEAIAARCKPARIYYFGDHYPSGQDISANVNHRLREFAPNAEIHFERVAVTRKQIVDWSLPTRPTKED